MNGGFAEKMHHYLLINYQLELGMFWQKHENMRGAAAGKTKYKRSRNLLRRRLTASPPQQLHYFQLYSYIPPIFVSKERNKEVDLLFFPFLFIPRRSSRTLRLPPISLHLYPEWRRSSDPLHGELSRPVPDHQELLRSPHHRR